MTVGILQAIVYIPLASLSINARIIYRSETLVTHQKIVVGIIGILYFSMLFKMDKSGFQVTYSHNRSLNTRKVVQRRSAMEIAITYPMMPI